MGRKKEMNELCCTNCEKYLRFPVNPKKNGNLVIVCDYCGHQHCRVVIDGVVTDDRWSSREKSVTRVKGIMHRTSLWDEEKKRGKR